MSKASHNTTSTYSLKERRKNSEWKQILQTHNQRSFITRTRREILIIVEALTK